MLKRSVKRACLHHLKHTFALEAYRPGQKAAVHALLRGRDILCILPTGAGKSLCWQLPALVHEGLTLVITPLIALMRDQVQHLAANGVPAASLNSLMTPEERTAVLNNIREGAIRIVFVSPERLENRAFRQLCREINPWMIVVDEAHCMVQWGESFRPAYTGIADFMATLRKRPVLCALTATADEKMQRAIQEALRMRHARSILLPIIRDNLTYLCRTTLDRTRDMLELHRLTPCRTVVFCRTRSRCEELSQLLNAQGFSADHYHAGLAREERMDVQQRFQEGRVEVLCATTAFGMGVDIPDIRRIVHEYLPENLIDYVQQSGRCGRDGQAAECIVLLEPAELLRCAGIGKQAMEKYRWRPVQRRRYIHKHWRAKEKLLKLLLTADCIPAGIARAFGSTCKRCGVCSSCARGPRLKRIPNLTKMKKWQIRAWLLTWQRDALAAKRNVSRGVIASDAELRHAAATLAFPHRANPPAELSRLVEYFRSRGE